MVGGLSSAEIIIVHARKVVVNEGHCMNHLHGTRSSHGVSSIATDQLASCQTEARPHSLSTGKQRVAHGLVDLWRLLERNGRLQGIVDVVCL